MSRPQRTRPGAQSDIGRPKLTRQPETLIGGTSRPEPPDVPLGATDQPAERHGAVAPRRQVGGTPVRRWSVRLYSLDEAQAWERLRLDLGQQLKRMPSLSEIAAAAGVLAATDDTVRSALVERLRQQE